MLQPGRHANTSDYRYGFQGQEMDDEIKGEGNSLNYTFRMHDPRLGRFFVVDPLTKEYPHYSPYSFSGNKVISFRELEGLEETETTFVFESNGNSKVKLVDANMIVDETKKRNEVLFIQLDGNRIEANSYKTLEGRDDGIDFVGDFSDIRVLSNKDISGLLGYADFVFETVHSLNSREEAVLMESNAGPYKRPTNLLDFKNSLYAIMGLKNDELIGIDGIAYNANEAGNYLWGLVLYEAGVFIDPQALAEIGSKGRKDEIHEQKAIINGKTKADVLKNYGGIDYKERQRTFDRYSDQYLLYLKEGGNPDKFIPEEGIFEEEIKTEKDKKG